MAQMKVPNHADKWHSLRQPFSFHVSCSRNSLKGVYIGDSIEVYSRGY